jgi:hypothetical protein
MFRLVYFRCDVPALLEAVEMDADAMLLCCLITPRKR